MAVDMFVVFDAASKIEGETGDKEFKEKKGIDILAWSWGLSQSGTTHTAGGGGAGKVNVQDLSITKYVDSASTSLVQSCCSGKHIPKVELFVRKAGDKPLTYIHLTMETVIVTSVSTGGSGGEDRLTENVTLNFAKFSLEYYKQKADGSGEKVGPVGFNMAENTKV